MIWYGVVPHKVCHMYPAKCVLGPVNGLPGHLRYGVGLKVGVPLLRDFDRGVTGRRHAGREGHGCGCGQREQKSSTGRHQAHRTP